MMIYHRRAVRRPCRWRSAGDGAELRQAAGRIDRRRADPVAIADAPTPPVVHSALDRLRNGVMRKRTHRPRYGRRSQTCPLKETIDAAHDEGAFTASGDPRRPAGDSALGLLSACAPLRPNHQRPAPLLNVVSEQAAVAGPLAQYKEAAKLLKLATPATGTTVASDWRKAFADPRPGMR